MKHSGNAPPITIPGKGRFMYADLTRNAKWLGVSDRFQHMPSNFLQALPELTLKVNRLLAATECLESQWNLVDAAFALIWETPKYRDSENGFALTEGGEAEFFVNMYSVANVTYPGAAAVEILVNAGKETVKKNTEKALELGAFGAPIFEFPNSPDRGIFFGSDRWEQMAFIMGKTWLGPNLSNRRSKI